MGFFARARFSLASSLRSAAFGTASHLRNARSKLFTPSAEASRGEPDWVVFVNAVVAMVCALFWMALVAVALVVVYWAFTQRK